MHEKELSLLAKVLPHMFARWRLHGDLEVLAGLPDGEIVLDARTGEARHFQAGPIRLRIAGELQAGLASQARIKGIGAEEIREAVVTVDVDTSRVNTDRKSIVHFDFRISSRIVTHAGVFAAVQSEEHVWHAREEEEPPRMGGGG